MDTAVKITNNTRSQERIFFVFAGVDLRPHRETFDQDSQHGRHKLT